MTAITTTNAPTEEFAFVTRQFNKVAWRRLWAISVALGIFGTVAASNKIDSTAEAFGYAVGYGGACLVLGAGTTVICGKGRRD